MPKNNTSQHPLTEMLIREIEGLKKSSEQINEAYWRIEAFLQQVDHRMDTYQVPVDIAPMQRESRHLEQVLKNRMVLPAWVWRTILIGLGVALLVCGGFIFRTIYEYKQEASHWKQQYDHLKQQQQVEPKPEL